MVSWLAILAIRFYQRTISPVLARRGIRCRHYPTCSEYAVLALQKYSFFSAVVRLSRRFRDCHPYSGRPYLDLP